MCIIHKYEKWKDITVFNFASCSYVLQGRKCKKCDFTTFTTSQARHKFGVATCDTLTEKMLTPDLWKPPTPTP